MIGAVARLILSGVADDLRCLRQTWVDRQSRRTVASNRDRGTRHRDSRFGSVGAAYVSAAMPAIACVVGLFLLSHTWQVGVSIRFVAAVFLAGVGVYFAARIVSAQEHPLPYVALLGLVIGLIVTAPMLVEVRKLLAVATVKGSAEAQAPVSVYS